MVKKTWKFLVWFSLILLILFTLNLPQIIIFKIDCFSLEFINDENMNGWIGYYGAVIGGSLTLIGVAITIVYQDKIKNEEIKLRYLPIIDVSSQIDKSKNNNRSYVFLDLLIKNIGRGEIYIDHVLINCDDKKMASYQTMIILPPDKIEKVPIAINRADIKDSENWSLSAPLKVQIELEGRDLFKEKIENIEIERYITLIDYKI